MDKFEKYINGLRKTNAGLVSLKLHGSIADILSKDDDMIHESTEKERQLLNSNHIELIP